MIGAASRRRPKEKPHPRDNVKLLVKAGELPAGAKSSWLYLDEKRFMIESLQNLISWRLHPPVGRGARMRYWVIAGEGTEWDLARGSWAQSA